MEEENKSQRMAKAIAEEVENIVSGKYYYDEVGFLKECKDGEDPASLYDFFEDAANIRWTVERDSAGGLFVVGGEIMVSGGGPNVWVSHNAVEVYWWSERGKCELSWEAGDAVLEYLREVFEI